jgi:hypothetical protein
MTVIARKPRRPQRNSGRVIPQLLVVEVRRDVAGLTHEQWTEARVLIVHDVEHRDHARLQINRAACGVPPRPVLWISRAAYYQSPVPASRRDAAVIAPTESLAGPCPVSVVPLVSVSAVAVACPFPCLSSRLCLPCLPLAGHYASRRRVSGGCVPNETPCFARPRHNDSRWFAHRSALEALVVERLHWGWTHGSA